MKSGILSFNCNPCIISLIFLSPFDAFTNIFNFLTNFFISFVFDCVFKSATFNKDLLLIDGSFFFLLNLLKLCSCGFSIEYCLNAGGILPLEANIEFAFDLKISLFASLISISTEG